MVQLPENIGMKQARKAPNPVVTAVDLNLVGSESPFQDQKIRIEEIAQH